MKIVVVLEKSDLNYSAYAPEEAHVVEVEVDMPAASIQSTGSRAS